MVSLLASETNWSGTDEKADTEIQHIPKDTEIHQKVLKSFIKKQFQNAEDIKQERTSDVMCLIETSVERCSDGWEEPNE